MTGIASTTVRAGQNEFVSTPTITNEAISTKNVEQSYALPSGTKYCVMQCRGDGVIKLSYTLGESGTKYFTVFPGQQKEVYNIASTSTITLYFQSSKDSQTLEIESWA